MSITKEQHQALDDALVPREQPFLISASVPAIYMHEFWATICPNLPGQKFEDPLFEEDILAFIKELGYLDDISNSMIPSLSNREQGGKEEQRHVLSNIPKVIITLYVKKITSIQEGNKVDRQMGEADQAPTASPGKRLKATAKVAKSGKKKQPTQALTPMVQKSSDEDDDNEVSLSKDDNDNADNKDNDGQDDDTESDNDSEDFVHPKFSTHDEEERQDDKDKEEEGSDMKVQTPSHFESIDDETYDEVNQRDNVEGEEQDEEEKNEEEEVNELYRDVNVNLERKDTEMTDALQTNVQGTQVIEDTQVIIIVVTPEVQQQSSSVSSGFISNMLNPNTDTCIDSILNLNTESTSLVDVPVTTNAEMPPSSVTTLPLPLIPLFEDRVKALEDDFLEFKRTNQFAEAVSSILGIVDKYLANQMNEAVKADVQLQSDKLRSEAQADNEVFINKIDENIKKIIKEQVKVQVKEKVSKILPKIEKFVNDQLKAEVLIRSSNEAKASHVVAANLSELELKKILINKMENNKSNDRSIQQKILYKALVDAYETDKDILETYGDTVIFKRRQDDEDEDEEPSAGSNRGSKRSRAGKEPESNSAPKEKTSKLTGMSKEGSKSHQKSTGNTLAQNEDPHESFNELIDTPLDFSAFVINRLKVDTLTSVLLSGPTYELMKVNRESARDVYSKYRILAVTKLKIIEWHNYKHLDWIIVRKLTNLDVEERLALGVSLQMFTRSIVLKRRMEDLQLVVKSYQKKLNLTRLDTYRSYLKRKTPYTAYSNPKGFIYHNKDKKNRLMRIDELHKFSDGTLNDVRSALDDILKRIRMEYLPQTVWRNVDRERAGAMIQAID
ncbi:hypothetical protein Tco_0746054 [Tanacetum coccineum]